MTLVSIIGDVGSGKTLFSTYLATKDKRPVYSNYKIKIKNYKPLKPETLLMLNEPSLVIIDEAYTWLESRLSNRKINLYSTYILFQSRKRELDIVLTEQLVATIDVRFRMMTNLEIYCEPVRAGFEYTLFKKSMYGRYKPVKFLMPYSIAEKVFPLYDTWQLIDPIDKNMIMDITQDKGDIIKEIDKHVKTILKTVPYAAITKGIVSDYCLREGLGKQYIDHIYHAIKASRFKP